jgi:hypothetical protein
LKKSFEGIDHNTSLNAEQRAAFKKAPGDNIKGIS